MDPFDWWALIGPVPAPHPAGIIAVPHDRTAVLDRTYRLGPLVLEPGDRRLTEYLRSEPFDLAGVTCFETWPVFVKGRWPDGLAAASDAARGLVGHERGVAIAASWLHRAVCLYSFAVGEGWQVRTSPIEMSRLPAKVPDDWPAPPTAQWSVDMPPDPERRMLPEWLETAWQALDADPALATALTLWHQGVLLTPTTPSFAYMAFCAAVEGISESQALRDRVEPVAAPCPECGNVPRATARFWATVRLVRDSARVDKMKAESDPYGRRSKTAHGRALHGIEIEYGRMHMLTYQPATDGKRATLAFDPNDHTQTFMWQQLPEMRQVAVDLLCLALRIDSE